MNTNDRKLEKTTCSRCGGTGHYSYCSSYGTTCFKCSGGKLMYTKRGAAAAKYLADSLTVRADSLVVGDLMYVRGFSCGSAGMPSKWYTIQEIRDKGDRLDLVCDGLTSGVFPSSMVRKAWSKAEKAEKVAAALDYQDTLTKAGKARKTRTK